MCACVCVLVCTSNILSLPSSFKGMTEIVTFAFVVVVDVVVVVAVVCLFVVSENKKIER